MSAATGPPLVYDRIDSNRRKTRLLLAVLGVLAVPSVFAAAAFLFLPLIVGFGTIILLYVFGVDPYTTGLGMLAWALASLLLSVVLCVAASVFAAREAGARFVLRLARARKVTPEQSPVLVHVVEELSIAAGLPPPAIALIDSPVANAFAVGRSPETATIAVTRGLLDLADRRQLAGIIGHELAHIGNHDTRLAGAVAVMTGMLAWPILAPFRLTRSRYRLVQQAGRVGLLLAALMLVGLLPILGGTLWAWLDPANADAFVDAPLVLRLILLVPFVAPFYALLIAPAVAFSVRSRICVQREFLADAQAALITRDPGALASALAMLRQAAGDIAWASSASHLFIRDPFALRPPVWHRWFPTHPPLDARLARLEEMFPGLRLERAKANGAVGGLAVTTTPLADRASIDVANPGHAGDVDAGDEAIGRHHPLRRTTRAERRSASWRDLPPAAVLRVVLLTPIAGYLCLSMTGIFVGLPLLGYAIWPLFSIVGAKRLVGTCPSCSMPLDAGTQPDAGSIVCPACQRTVFIEGDTFVEGDLGPAPHRVEAVEHPASPAAYGGVSQPGETVGVPIYRDPDGWSPVVTTLPPNTTVQPLGTGAFGNFVQIRVGGTIGYVSRSAALVFEKAGASAVPGDQSRDAGHTEERG